MYLATHMKSMNDGIKSPMGMGIHYTDPQHPIVQFALSIGKNTKTILDIGTGRGVTALALARAGANVTAVDIDKQTLKTIHHPRVHTYVHDAGAAMPWGGIFDFVVAKDVYPFLSPIGIHGLLRNAAKVLRRDGFFLFTFPSYSSDLFRRVSRHNGHRRPYQRLTKNAQQFIPTTREYFSFGDEALARTQLARHGFSMEKSFSFGRANGWMAVLARKK